ncbi:hypothetical protein Aduo_002518 [Ancylostoma duodenale]
MVHTKFTFLLHDRIVLKELLVVADPEKPDVQHYIDHRRLYFGSVYNVTGYIFMNAFAFAEPCTCDPNACCGTFTIKEFLYSNDIYAYTSTAQLADKTPSDVDQIFYIVNAEVL